MGGGGGGGEEGEGGGGHELQALNMTLRQKSAGFFSAIIFRRRDGIIL